MDRSTPIYLVQQTRTQNSIGEWITSESLRRVFANVASISASEYFNASQIGLNPEIKFTMFAPDYDGETVVEYLGHRYSVYRIYRATADRMELYVQREAGTAGTTVTTTETTTEATTETTTDGNDQG
jgi:hypothetical protein